VTTPRFRGQFFIMKKLLALLFAASFTLAAETYTDLRPKLSEVTDAQTGITTTTYVARQQSDPAKDGTTTLTVFAEEVKTLNGIFIAKGEQWIAFSVPLTEGQRTAVVAIIKAKWDADHAPAPGTP
jgi:hypothetical protein